MLDHIGQVERHTKCNNFIHEPAVRNAHLASAAAEHQRYFHTYLGSARMPALLRSKALNKGTFFGLRLDKQGSIAIYNAKLDAPSRYGLEITTTLA